MIDIELQPPITDVAYAAVAPGAFPRATSVVDPSYADTKAYTKPSLGGELGVGRVALRSGPADGGLALLEADAVVTVAAAPVATPPYSFEGRAWNVANKVNLYPWMYGERLDSNNPPQSPL